MNQLPAELKDEMQEHLRLKFNHQEASDDQVGTDTAVCVLQNIALPLQCTNVTARCCTLSRCLDVLPQDDEPQAAIRHLARTEWRQHS